MGAADGYGEISPDQAAAYSYSPPYSSSSSDELPGYLPDPPKLTLSHKLPFEGTSETQGDTLSSLPPGELVDGGKMVISPFDSTETHQPIVLSEPPPRPMICKVTGRKFWVPLPPVFPHKPSEGVTKEEHLGADDAGRTMSNGSFLKGRKRGIEGRVISPYPPYKELDITGLASGSLALDPTTQKVFEVP